MSEHRSFMFIYSYDHADTDKLTHLRGLQGDGRWALHGCEEGARVPLPRGRIRLQ